MIHNIISNIPINPKEIYDYALSKSFLNWIDEKDSKDNPGISRKPSKLSYEEAFQHIQNNTPHWVISFRDNSSWHQESFWEFGGCNIGSNDYGSVFIWINVKIKEAEKIFKKFNLKQNVY